MTATFLERVYNHIVLPPQVPSGQDDDLLNIGYDIKQRIQRACGSLRSTSGTQYAFAWDAIDMGVTLNNKADGQHQTLSSLLAAFEHLHSELCVLPLYIAEQNAGLLVYQQKK